MTDAPAGEDAEYWQALGQFLEAFAIAESGLYLYTVRHAELVDPIARLVTESWKTTRLIGFLTELWKLKPLPPESAELKSVLGRFAAIDTMRNGVVHYASFITIDGERLTTNKLRSLDKKTRVFRVSPAILADMISDVNRIDAHFISALINPTLSLRDREAMAPILGRAWRYTPDPNPTEKFLKRQHQRAPDPSTRKGRR